MAVWKRKGAAARDTTSSVLERLEWFDRTEVAPPAPAVDEPEREPERELEPALAVPATARPTEWLLPAPPWEAERQQVTREVVLEPEPVEAEPEEPAVEVAPQPRVPQRRPARAAVRSRRSRVRAVALGLVTVTVSAVFILGTSALRSDEPDEAVASKPTPKIAPTPARKPALHRKPAAKPTPHPKPRAIKRPAPATRTPAKLPPFAWSPVAGATAYDFQLFRGPRLVYSKRTHRPGITVPQVWSSHGRLVHLAPGSYRWYVWAVIGGQRSDRAIVQATLDVPR